MSARSTRTILTWAAALASVCAARPASASAPTVTAVFDVEVQGFALERASLVALSDYLATSLAATGRHRVVPRDELEKRLRDQKAASYRACYEESCQIEVGKELAADHALATKIVKLGAQCVLTMKLFELKSAATTWAATARGPCAREALLDLVEAALKGAPVAKDGAEARDAKPAAPTKPDSATRSEPGPRDASSPAAARSEPSDGGTRTSEGAAGASEAKRPQACDRYAAHGLSGRADPRALPVLTAALGYVEKSYFDPSRVDARAMFHAALTEVAKCTPGVALEERADGPTLVVKAATLAVPVASTTSLWKLLVELRRATGWLDDVLDASVDRRALEYAALSGATSVLDAHTTLYTPKQAAELKTTSAGQFGGIGATLAIRDERLTILGALAGTPVERAGLRAQDHVVAIDGRPTRGLAMEDAVARLRGAPGTDVELTIERGGKTTSVTLRREMIKIPATKSERLADGVGYIRIHQFHAGASAEVDAALEKLGPVRGLVLDLRSNPGGLLDQTVKVADRFLASGVIVGTAGRDGSNKDERTATASSTDVAVPLVVLVDGATSSGAEILAGALEHHDRALLVGLRTFGKGTVQTLPELPDGSMLRLTIAQYLAAGGRAFAERGFTPNVLVRDAAIAPNVADDAVIDLAAKLLRAAPAAKRRTELLDALRRQPTDPRIDRIVAE
ncbi:S41 family peptidase [Myxococcota bacterium]|nr:S41 family peptidase [Myxococcota bacterium]